MEEDMITLPLEIKEDSLIKVVGVGGGGGNAVNYMYKQGIKDVTFLTCNTDKMALGKMSVPAKLQLGPGLGAGGEPEKARAYAEESREHIREALNDGTKMLFITAGMGGGTGTGASPIVAEVAQEMGILTVGIVTIPFAFEMGQKIRKAMIGVATLAKHVDALLIINNEKLKDIYPDLTIFNAFDKSNDVVANAARSIAEIITIPGVVNTDFADVYNTLRHGGVAIMNVGRASGEYRISTAINNALNSPLVNTNDVHGAKRLLLQFYCSTEHAIQMSEIDQINNFVKEIGDSVEVQWGAAIDEELGEDVRVTIIATGYEVNGLPTLDEEEGGKTIDEAIQDNYQEKPSSPKDDEKAQVISFGETIFGETKKEEPEQKMHQDDPEGDDLEIHIDDEKEPDSVPEPSRRPFGSWMHRR